MTKIRGKNQLSGTHGKLWWDGNLIAEIISFEAKVTANRESVQIDMDEDSKLVGLKGEISFKVRKFYTRGKRALLNAWKKGEDPRSFFKGDVADPDAIGKQVESISIDNVWFDDLTLMSFEKGKPMEEEYKGGFTPSDADFLDTIEVL